MTTICTFQGIRQFPELPEAFDDETHVHAKVTEGAIVVACHDILHIFTPGTDPQLIHSVKMDSVITSVSSVSLAFNDVARTIREAG